ncbi:MAG TPA: ABC transporter permease [Polyangiaceae bacterium]|nr:ABC transporter permease [Polyangiaceae bacterium]
MGFPLELSIRYIRSRKRAFISVGTLFAILGVLLGVAALTTVVSVTGGFFKEFQDKVLGVNAHVLVLKYASDFREYRDVMKVAEKVPGVRGVAPFFINPMMVTHGRYTATGVLLKGIDPERVNQVLDLPKHIIEGNLDGLRVKDSKPPSRRSDPFYDGVTLGVTDERGGVTILPSNSAEPMQRSAPTAANTAVKKLRPSVAAPEGDVEPEGGYQSVLPDEDVIPSDIWTDPCHSPDKIASLPGIAVGKTLRENLHLSLGDCMQITFPTVGFSYSGGVIRAPVAKQFRVIAVFDAGFDQYDSKLVYTDLYQAQSFNDSGDSVTGIEMKVADIDQSKRIAAEIERRLDNGIYHTMDWEELNHGLFTALRIQQILISVVLALIIVVAAFTVIATLIMVVLEKKREIAVLKAMGSSDFSLLRVFLYQGAFIGIVGTVLGLGLGYFTCRGLVRYEFPLDPGVYFISRLPVRMQPLEFAMVGAFAILVCLIATVWPALYASRLRPAEAFRSQD